MIDCRPASDSETTAITDSWWAENIMTVANGVARLSCINKSLTAQYYYYKVVKRAYNGETELYTQWNDQQTLTISDAANYNVTFYYNISSKTPSAEAVRIPTAYYYVGGTSSFTVGDALTETDGVYSITLSDLSGNDFVIVPDFAIENGAVKYVENGYNGWNYAIRPASTQTISDFANYSGDATTTNSSQNWSLTYSGSLTFTYDPSTNTWSAVPYFERTLNSAAEGYATFSSEYAVALPEGVVAKYASSVSDGTIGWTAIENGIPANTGVLLYAAGKAGQSLVFTPATTADDVTDNLFQPISEVKKVDQTEDSYTNFILSKVNSTLGFYKVYSSGSYCAAGTAYLKVPTAQVPAAREFFFLFDDETTKIENRNYNNNDNSCPAYNLAGQRVLQPTKGLYIVGGKKVVVK